MARRDALEAPRDDEAPASASSEVDAESAEGAKEEAKPKKGKAVRGMTGFKHTKLHANVHVALHAS